MLLLFLFRIVQISAKCFKMRPAKPSFPKTCYLKERTLRVFTPHYPSSSQDLPISCPKGGLLPRFCHEYGHIQKGHRYSSPAARQKAAPSSRPSPQIPSLGENLIFPKVISLGYHPPLCDQRDLPEEETLSLRNLGSVWLCHLLARRPRQVARSRCASVSSSVRWAHYCQD